MKQSKRIYALIIPLLMVMIASGCKKDENLTKPVIASFLVTEVSSTSAVCGGEITSDGGSAITARGVCWNTVKHPLVNGNHTSDGTGSGIFTSSITGLTAGRKYYARVYASNSTGTSYGHEMAFTTINAYQVSDVDGNVYNTITLGAQTWLTEGLKTSKFNDSTVIPRVNGASAWSSLDSAATCWYNNDSAANKANYGALYNWYAVNTGKLCPQGWHVPSDPEWKELEMFLGMTQGEADATGFRGFDQGIQVKNTTGWNNRGSGTNSSGFSAQPGGVRNSDGIFEALGNGNNWWSSSTYDTNNAWKRGLYYSYGGIFRGFYGKTNGYSVRCVKNEGIIFK